MVKGKTPVTPLLTHWSYFSLALNHRFVPCVYQLIKTCCPNRSLLLENGVVIITFSGREIWNWQDFLFNTTGILHVCILVDDDPALVRVRHCLNLRLFRFTYLLYYDICYISTVKQTSCGKSWVSTRIVYISFSSYFVVVNMCELLFIWFRQMSLHILRFNFQLLLL